MGVVDRGRTPGQFLHARKRHAPPAGTTGRADGVLGRNRGLDPRDVVYPFLVSDEMAAWARTALGVAQRAAAAKPKRFKPGTIAHKGKKGT